MWILSGDIRDQSRKLSEIAQNFGRFFGPRKFMGEGLPKIVTPTIPEVIEPNTLNFSPNF